MLSLNQAIEIKESILAYLKATFTFQDNEVHDGSEIEWKIIKWHGSILRKYVHL